MSGLRLNFTIICVSLVLSFFMFGNNIDAEFSVIDDHNIVSLVGDDNYFSAADAVDFVKDDSDFKFGSYGRFRPSFQIGRAFEMYLFDDNVFYYQVARLSLFFLIISIFSIFIIKNSGIVYGTLISLILISEKAWVDIFTRIITSELYTIYGLVIFIPITFKIVTLINTGALKKNRLTIACIALLYLLSGLMTIGSKENFSFLIIVPIFIIYIIYKSNIRNNFIWILSFFSLILILFGLLTPFMLFSYFFYTPENLSGYGIFSGFDTLVRIFYSFFNTVFYEWLLYLIVLPYLLFIFSRRKVDFLEVKELFKEMFFLIFILTILLGFQVIYYTGGLPSETRYDFPNIFFYSLYLMLLLHFSKKILPFFIKNKKILNLVIFIPFVMIFAVKNPILGIVHANGASYEHKERTKEFKLIVDAIVDFSNTSPKADIVVNSYDVWDYELISSFYKFIRVRGISNNLYLKLHFDGAKYSSEVEQIFVGRLEDVSEGLGLVSSPDWFLENDFQEQWGYNPLANFSENSAGCIALDLKKSIDNQCSSSILFNYKGH